MAKSWLEKHDAHPHPAHVERLTRPFGGLPEGATIVIATPKDISSYFRATPRGRTRTMDHLRAHLAKKYGADGACPLTTGIFSRIAAENAIEAMAMGALPDEVAPFWRVVDPDSPLAKKLTGGSELVRRLRLAEGIEDKPRTRKTAKKAAAKKAAMKKNPAARRQPSVSKA